MKKYAIGCCLFTLAIMGGCFQKAFTPKEYYEWSKNPESNLYRNIEGNGVKFCLKYIPADLLICNEIRNNILGEKDISDRREELGDLTYFNLRIESGEKDLLMFHIQDEQEYLQRVNYYSMDFQYDIIAVTGKDTIPCVLYQFENTYGVTPHINMSIAFPGQILKANNTDSVSILVDDRVFGNNIMRFTYIENELNEVPDLILE